MTITKCEKKHEDAKSKLRKLSQMDQNLRDKLRHELMGSTKFLVELFYSQILSIDFIIEIIQDLLLLECVESIEPMCKLLELLCEGDISIEIFRQFFDHLSNIQNKFTTRIRFMIQNLVEKAQKKL